MISEGVPNSQVRKVAKVDLVGIVLLTAAAVAEYI
jgi:ribosomal protein S12